MALGIITLSMMTLNTTTLMIMALKYNDTNGYDTKHQDTLEKSNWLQFQKLIVTLQATDFPTTLIHTIQRKILQADCWDQFQSWLIVILNL